MVGGAVKDNPALVSVGIAGGFGIFVWTYLGMSLILKASRKLYTKRANIEADIRFATEVQERILQDVLLELNGTKAFARSLPANELGGDYFELSTYKHSIFATVGDISGHSFGAGLLMTMTKSAVQTHLQYNQDPAQVMSALNKMLVKQSDPTMYATMTMLNIDLKAKKGIMSNAGHPPIFHFSKSDNTIHKRTNKALGLGILEKAEYSNYEFSIDEGDFLILYSDGLVEIRDDDLKVRDSEYFEQIIQKMKLESHDSPEDVVQTLLDKVQKEDHSESFEDDATLVVIKV